MTALTNNSIRLRALEPGDVDLLYRWENDPETRMASNTRTPVSKYILASYIRSGDKDFWESRELRLMIEDSDGNALGTIELFDFEPYHMRAGVGVMVFETAHRQKGIASTALEILMDYARNELGIYQLWANIAESNTASLNLFRKMGFEITGHKTNWLKIPGKAWEGEYLLQRILG